MNKAEIEAIVEAKLRLLLGEVLGLQKTNNQNIEFVQTTEAAKKLGYRNARPLYHLIKTGVLRIGKEVQDRRSPQSVNADYWFNISACQKRLNTPPEKREA